MYNVHIEYEQYKFKDLIIKKHKNKKYILMKYNIWIIYYFNTFDYLYKYFFVHTNVYSSTF